MPSKSDLEKLSKHQRKFYKNIFSANFTLPPTNKEDKFTAIKIFPQRLPIRKPARAIQRFILQKTTSIPPLSFPMSSLIADSVLNIHILMLNQHEDIQKIIIDQQIQFLLPLLKAAYAYENNIADDDPNFWVFITAALRESIEHSYKQDSLINYMANCVIWRNYFYGVNPRDYFSNLSSLLMQLNYATPEQRDITILRAQEVYQQICHEADMLYKKITHVDRRRSLLISAGALALAAPMLLYGIPLLSFTIGGIGLGGAVISFLNARKDPKFTAEIEDYLINKGKKNSWDCYGIRMNLSIANETQWRQFFIDQGVNILLGELTYRRFTKIEYDADEGELYIPSDDFPQLQKSPLSAQYKLGAIPKSTSPQPIQSLEPKETKKEKKARDIQLPDDLEGKLVYGSNHSLMIVKPPAKDSGISQEDIDEVKLPRGIVTAKKYGQSGLKYAKGCLFLKDKNSGQRIQYIETNPATITVNGRPQHVPVYEPVISFNK